MTNEIVTAAASIGAGVSTGVATQSEFYSALVTVGTYLLCWLVNKLFRKTAV